MDRHYNVFIRAVKRVKLSVCVCMRVVGSVSIDVHRINGTVSITTGRNLLTSTILNHQSFWVSDEMENNFTAVDVSHTYKGFSAHIL